MRMVLMVLEHPETLDGGFLGERLAQETGLAAKSADQTLPSMLLDALTRRAYTLAAVALGPLPLESLRLRQLLLAIRDRLQAPDRIGLRLARHAGLVDREGHGWNEHHPRGGLENLAVILIGHLTVDAQAQVGIERKGLLDAERSRPAHVLLREHVRQEFLQPIVNGPLECVELTVAQAHFPVTVSVASGKTREGVRRGETGEP